MGCYHSHRVMQQVEQQKKNNNHNQKHKNVHLNYPVQVSNSRGIHARFQKRNRRRIIL